MTHTESSATVRSPEGDELLALVRRLVQVESITGQEGDVAHFIFNWLIDSGVDAKMVPVPSDWQTAWEGEANLADRPNVVARVPGTGAIKAPLVLNGHIDTVPFGDANSWSDTPLSGKIRDGRLYGRGASDMKAGIAAAMFAVRSLAHSESVLPFDVILQCVIGEESGGIGSHYLIDHFERPGAAIVLEPTEGRLVTACGGTAPFTIETYGRSAHVGTPWAGVDALEQAIRLHGNLRSLEADRQASLSHPLFDHLPNAVPVSFGVLHAGTWRLTTPDYAILQGRIGSLPHETLEQVREQVERLIETEKKRSTQDGVKPPRVTWHPAFEGWETSIEHPLSQAFIASINRQGGSAEPSCVTYGSDASVFANRNINVLLYGPGEQVEAHAPNESADIDQIVDVYFVLTNAIQLYARTVAET